MHFALFWALVTLGFLLLWLVSRTERCTCGKWHRRKSETRQENAGQGFVLIKSGVVCGCGEFYLSQTERHPAAPVPSMANLASLKEGLDAIAHSRPTFRMIGGHQ